MIDLAFVRENLALVEEKLRSRGMDPAAVLGNFADVDLRRRGAITEAETIKAQRNRLTEEFAKLKREGKDATDLTEIIASSKVNRRPLNPRPSTPTPSSAK
jgi:seryl-tRNA synthetase